MSHGGTCSHNHDCSEHECAGGWSLYKSIHVPKVRALNEAEEGSAASIFKPWERRLDFNTVLESNDDDPELLIFVPFTTDVKIRSISVIGGAEGSAPCRMRVFTNREDVDFSVANEATPVQEWSLVENRTGEFEYQTKFAKFQGIANISLHFPENSGADVTRIHYIGFRGEATQINRQAVANVVYEALPNPKDHQAHSEQGAPQIL